MHGGVIHLPEADRIDQCQCRHIENHVAEQTRVKVREALRHRQPVQQRRTDQVNDPQQSLGIEVLVCDQPDHEGRNDGAPGLGGVSERALGPGGSQIDREVAAHRDEPPAPDKELKQHHRPKADSQVAAHARIFPMSSVGKPLYRTVR